MVFGRERPRADRRPGHLVYRGDPDILEAGFRHQLGDPFARPVVSDPRQHLVEHDRSQMAELEPRQQFEIFDRPQPEPQPQPQQRRRIEREVVDERDRQAAEERTPQRVQQRNEPAVALAAVDPDQHPAARFDGADHVVQRPLRIFEVMDDADREGNVEAIGKGQIVGARSQDFDRRKAGEVAPRARKRALVDVDGTALARPVGHRPEAVAAHAAADIEKAFAPPILRCQVDRPTAKLLFVIGQDFGIGVPLLAKTVG